MCDMLELMCPLLMRYRVAIWKRARKMIPLSDYLAATQPGARCYSSNTIHVRQREIDVNNVTYTVHASVAVKTCCSRSGACMFCAIVFGHFSTLDAHLS